MKPAFPVAVIGAGWLFGVLLYPTIPEPASVPGWNPAVTRPLIAFVLPAAATVTYLILRSLSARLNSDRSGDEDHAPEAILLAIASIVVSFVTIIHLLVLLNLSGASWLRAAGPRIVVVLFGGLIIAVGNLLPLTRPNLAIGIRTERTLSDRLIWIRVHRTCGYVAVALGTVIVFAGVFLAGHALGIVVGAGAVSSMAVVVASYRKHCAF